MSALLILELEVTQNQTVLPRCLQILSRRGFTLLGLTTQPLDENIACLRLTCQGPRRWQASIAHFLERLIDVHSVEVLEVEEA